MKKNNMFTFLKATVALAPLVLGAVEIVRDLIPEKKRKRTCGYRKHAKEIFSEAKSRCLYGGIIPPFMISHRELPVAGIRPSTVPPEPRRPFLAPVMAAVPLLALAATACADAPWPDPPPIAPEALAAEHEEWRLYRQGRLVEPPGGAVIWIGLWELREGEAMFGSDSSLSIVLPAEDSPPVAGTLRRTGSEITLEPAADAGLRLRTEDGDAPLTAPLAMRNDRADDPTQLVLGSLGLRIHAEMGTDRLWLRAWDEDSPKRDAFRLPPFYPVDPAWRLAARMEPYAEPRAMELADVTDGTVSNVAQGELVFRAEGREHRLVAFATETSKDYFVMLWDSTATVDTYPGGRYMKVPFPDEDGWTVMDFNRAYNPPCVFTPYSVCSFPPRESRLDIAITAGEKAPPPEAP